MARSARVTDCLIYQRDSLPRCAGCPTDRYECSDLTSKEKYEFSIRTIPFSPAWQDEIDDNACSYFERYAASNLSDEYR